MKTKSENRQIGNLGEDLACMFLMKQGFSIIDRNYWKKFGELDIIAQRNNKIHFIEVKSVTNSLAQAGETFNSGGLDCFRPEDNVHPAKLARLSRTIQTYLIEKGVSDETDWQFDVVTVYLNMKDKTAKVEILEDIVIT